MKITIDYESSWRNSFLDGSNDENLPKKGRKYKAASSNLNPKQKNKESTYHFQGITENTVMGILNRLIGDQRKLYQSRSDENYYFKEIENSIDFDDIDSKRCESNEIVYLRNMGKSFDQNSFVGCISLSRPSISSVFSERLWGVLNLDFSNLIKFILDDSSSEALMNNLEPLTIIDKIQSFKDLKEKKVEDIDKFHSAIAKLNSDESISAELKKLFPKMQKTFLDGIYLKEDTVQVRSLYCSALYLQLIRLSTEYDISAVSLKGISVNGLTPKDFLEPFTGGKKMVWGNPYVAESFIKGEGKIKKTLTKASGQLEINLDIDFEKAKELKSMIDDAGVSSFYLGKKGLAYVSEISIR